MAETFPYIGSLDVVHKGQDPKVDQMLIRSFGLNSTLARAYLNTAIEGQATGAEPQVTFDTETAPGFDIGGNFASNKYTAPVPGYYHIDWCVYMYNDGGTITGGLSYLNKNAVSSSGVIGYGTYAAAIGGQVISVGGGLHQLATGDYLTVSATGITASSTWKLIATPMTFISVYLVAKV